jgi:alpha-tubulin suppressor-like RCC1 family protein
MWGLWLAMPLLIGSAAVAEERRVGVTESQFCLPVSRRSQFLIKFITGLILSLVLGGAMPFIIERARDFNGWMFAVAAAIFFISFYASTLARTTLQAIGLTLVLSPAIYLYLVGEAIAIAKLGHNYTYSSLGLALLRVRLGVPILLLVLACLTLGNFKWLLPDWKLWRRNLITVLSAFATLYILSHAIYFRAWELLVPCPQPQGPARLSASSPTKFAFIFNTLSAVLPDGRLWIETLAYEYSGNGVTLAPERFKASFIDGSNWTDVAQSWLQILAIQSDGSLWRAEKKFIGGAGWGYEIGKFSRFDSQTNWQGVVASRYGNGGFLLLTKEGALWNWGTNWARTSSQKLVLDSKATPNQIDQETNWTEVLSLGGYACARNQNGNVWRWDMTGTNSTFHLVQETNSEFALSLADNESWRAMVSGDGELWLSWSTWANNYWHVSGTNRIGSDSKWKAVAFANNFLIALRRDGTLWRWRVSEVFAPVAHSDKPTQVGNYSHWIVLDDMGAVSLAADGTIWGWDHPSRYKWLAPSRRPVYLGNIFITQ